MGLEVEEKPQESLLYISTKHTSTYVDATLFTGVLEQMKILPLACLQPTSSCLDTV